MSRCLLFTIVVFFNWVTAFSQAKDSLTKTRIQFHSINQLGLIRGQLKEPEIQLQTVNGIQVKKIFFGIGAGIDYYAKKSIPVFADLRTSLPFANRSFFVYGDAGVNFPWERDIKEEWVIFENKKGLYYDVGAGYSVKTGKRSAFLISLGYCRKEAKEKTTNYWVNGGETVYGQSYNFSYQQRRIVLKLGWMF